MVCYLLMPGRRPLIPLRKQGLPIRTIRVQSRSAYLFRMLSFYYSKFQRKIIALLTQNFLLCAGLGCGQNILQNAPGVFLSEKTEAFSFNVCCTGAFFML